MTPLEKAAKAAYEKYPTASRGPLALGFLHWAELQEWQKGALCEAQRAALEALMEPTPEMIHAGNYCEGLRDEWQAVLKEAMK